MKNDFEGSNNSEIDSLKNKLLSMEKINPWELSIKFSIFFFIKSIKNLGLIYSPSFKELNSKISWSISYY